MQASILYFDQFELDLNSYELRKSGHAIKLEKLPMELLILLAEKRGQLVTREQIIQRLWGDDVFVDTRQRINTAIRKIRVALRDEVIHLSRQSALDTTHGAKFLLGCLVGSVFAQIPILFGNLGFTQCLVLLGLGRFKFIAQFPGTHR